MTKDEVKQLEADLWHAADNLRANSDLKASEYSTPVLGLIFLKFADNNYRRHEAEIIALASPARRIAQGPGSGLVQGFRDQAQGSVGSRRGLACPFAGQLRPRCL